MGSTQQPAKVMWNRPVGGACYRIGLTGLQGYGEARPGQFVMVHLGAGHPSLLRRPFSIFNLIGDAATPEGIELLYKVVGKGTARLASLAENDRVDVVGPLGHGFRIGSKGPFMLAAGGIGVAPIHFLAGHLVTRGITARQCGVFIGGRTGADILCREAFEALGMSVTVTTDDGSSGDQCLITDPLEAAIVKHKPKTVFACGPVGMLQCLAGIASRQRVACQMSIETLMACGLGACMGCAVESHNPGDGYRHTCVHGPVFDVGDLNWDALGHGAK